MKHGAYLLRYLLIIRRLRAVGSCSFEQLHTYLFDSELRDFAHSYSLRSFQRDILDIRTLFGIQIQSSRAGYAIEDQGLDESFNLQLLEAFDLQRFLSAPAALSPFVQAERRRPRGTEHLHPLLLALQQRVQVQFDYRKFWEDTPTPRIVSPLLLKEFKGRWYLLAFDSTRRGLRCFGLDRLHRLEISNRVATAPAGFDPSSYYEHSFGIIRPDNEAPVSIVLALEPVQGQYLKTFPLHSTQQVVLDTDTEVRVQLTVYNTHDLLMELLSLGNEVRVISPSSLRQQIQQIHAAATG
jgi:predicted DNA-binding transcriptional regulator YafY